MAALYGGREDPHYMGVWRGIVIGLLLSLPLWGGIYVLVMLAWKYA